MPNQTRVSKPDGEFLLHMSSEGKLEAEERISWLTVRDAISWLNEAPDEFGSFWECAMDLLSRNEFNT